MSLLVDIGTWFVVVMFAFTVFFPFFLGVSLRLRDPEKLQIKRHFHATLWLCLFILVSTLFLFNAQGVMATTSAPETDRITSFVFWVVGAWLVYAIYGPGLIWLGYLFSPTAWFGQKRRSGWKT